MEHKSEVDELIAKKMYNETRQYFFNKKYNPKKLEKFLKELALANLAQLMSGGLRNLRNTTADQLHSKEDMAAYKACVQAVAAAQAERKKNPPTPGGVTLDYLIQEDDNGDLSLFTYK
jgi:hypothetical protein